MVELTKCNKLINIIKTFVCKNLRIKHRAINTVKYYFNKQNTLIAVWWVGDKGKNWGDALNPILIGNLSGKKVVNYHDIYNFKRHPVYSVIGSILGTYKVDNLIVWGSGFISSSSTIKKKVFISAVRGPLTREKLISNGIDCPEIYGDPALLYPLFYNPKKHKSYKLGIIPHFVDQDEIVLKNFKNNKDVLIIDILDDIKNVVDSICSCEMIASSSLHGIIAADAYGIPSIWVEFSNKIQGKRFKYYDYFSSVGRDLEEPLFLIETSNPIDIHNYFKEYTINIDLLKLLNSCPFIEEKKIGILTTRLKNLHAEGYIRNNGIFKER